MLVCKAGWCGPGGRGHCYPRARNRSRLSRPPLHSQENGGRTEHHSLTHVLSMRAPASPLSQTPSSSESRASLIPYPSLGLEMVGFPNKVPTRTPRLLKGCHSKAVCPRGPSFRPARRLPHLPGDRLPARWCHHQPRANSPAASEPRLHQQRKASYWT